MQPEEYNFDDAAIKQMVQTELQEILGVSGRPDFMIVARYPNSMPQYHVGHVDFVRQIREQAQQLPHLALAGNAYDGVGIPDTIASGEQGAEAIFRA